jgi:LysM repeat protein
MRKTIFLLVAVCAALSSAVAQTLPTHVELFDKMMASIANVKTMKFRLVKNERMISGKMAPGDQQVKMQVNPFKCYLKIAVPNEGAEVLFIKGTNDNNALVNPNAFPYMNLNLDPYGDILRKDNHHTIHELGFIYTGELLKDAFDRYKHKINEFMKNEGIIKWDGRDVYKIVLDNKDYVLNDYTVLAGEDLIKIARKKKVSEYNLMEINGLKNYTSVKAGQVIKVPITYAKRIIVYIDKLTTLPIYQELYDNKGLLATYEYHNLLVNPVITDAEFTKDYKDYGY